MHVCTYIYVVTYVCIPYMQKLHMLNKYLCTFTPKEERRVYTPVADRQTERGNLVKDGKKEDANW